MAKIGFIGMGNMGQAILNGVLRAMPKEDLLFSAKTAATKEKISTKTGVAAAASNKACAASCKYLVLAVKPQFYQEVISEIKEVLTKEQVIISLAPGRTIAQLKESMGTDMRIVRVMPNTPAMIGEGMSGMCVEDGVLTEEEKAFVTGIFTSCGSAQWVPERLMDAVVCASGSSPAFVYMFIEALADAAVRCGMPRKQAYIFAAQAVKGSAAMVLETGEHPGVLKDNVCSPAGTTIEGVAALEEAGMRSAVMKACEAVYKKCTSI